MEKRYQRRLRKANFYKNIKAECIRCGEKEHLFLDFHHVGAKRFKISNLLNRSVSAPHSNWPALLKAELKECVPLCVLCHRRLHAGQFTLTEEQKKHRVVIDGELFS